MYSQQTLDGGGTESLFDSAGVWRSQPLVAFLSLLTSDTDDYRRTNNSTAKLPAGHTLGAKSAVVYEAMFNKYLQHLAARRLNLVEVNASHVDAFLIGELSGNTKETIWRYLRLLERVYDHLVQSRILEANPVTLWVHSRQSAGESPKVGRDSEMPPTITRAEVERIQDWLYTKGRAEMTAGNWRAARDLTLGSVSLGTGMRCAELLALSREQVKHWPSSPCEERFQFDIPRWASVATARAHATQAGVACVGLMEQWWALRWSGFPTSQGVARAGKKALPAGGLVFPATLTGSRLDHSTVFKGLKRLAKEAAEEGVLSSTTLWVLSRGAQGLRRAYTLTELESRTGDQLLTYRLGMWHQRSLRRYREQTSALNSVQTSLL